MIRIINAWIVRKYINNALWVYGCEAGIFSQEEQSARIEKLRRDLEGAARLELITPQQYRKLRARILE